MNSRHDAHRAFLNRYYGWSRPIYDLTRKPYLLGRDAALASLLADPWSTLVEVGPGTGRNLDVLAHARPTARLGGVEACDVMLAETRRRHPGAALVRGFAEDVDLSRLMGAPVDRVLFSYSLSMIQEPRRALDVARRHLAPGGKIVVVDFGDLAAVPRPVARLFRRWLETFHVSPLSLDVFDGLDASLTWGPARYWLRVEISAG